MTTAVALICGSLYVAFAFALGWEIGSLFVALLILAVVAFAIVTALATVLPVEKRWFYPLMFSFPSLMIGLLAIRDNFTFFGVGCAALCASIGSEYFVRWRTGRRSAL